MPEYFPQKQRHDNSGKPPMLSSSLSCPSVLAVRFFENNAGDASYRGNLLNFISDPLMNRLLQLYAYILLNKECTVLRYISNSFIAVTSRRSRGRRAHRTRTTRAHRTRTTRAHRTRITRAHRTRTTRAHRTRTTRAHRTRTTLRRRFLESLTTTSVLFL